jgi:glutamate racemase
MKGRQAIGVFDSGLGGLTVLKELKQQLPYEDFIYLGDIARLPYGNKSPQVVSKYAVHCVNQLVSDNVKAVVVACNTASSAALPLLKEKFQVPIFGMITPGVSAAMESKKERILVLATAASVRSEAYPKEFVRQGFQGKVEQLVCPLFVPLAEEGWFDHEVTEKVIRSYLDQVKKFEYEAVLLGCTHYPLLIPSFQKVLGETIPLIHGAKNLAEELKEWLRNNQLGNPSDNQGQLTFSVTDPIPSTLPMVQYLFGESVSFSWIDL